MYFSKLVKKIQVSLESNKHNWCLHEDLSTFMTIFRSVLGMRNISDKFVEKIKTHILCEIDFSKIVSFMR
jgi:hypothetical protein